MEQNMSGIVETRGIDVSDIDRGIEEEVSALWLPDDATSEQVTNRWLQMIGLLVGGEFAKLQRLLKLERSETDAILANLKIETLQLRAEFEKHIAKRDAESETRIATRLAAIETEIERKLSRIKDGAKGDPGPAGVAGRDGKLPAVKSWVSGVVFYEGDCVFHGGSAWQATEDNAKEPGASASWRRIAAGGRDAQPWRIRGTWRADAKYVANDVVILDSSSFIALTANPGPVPGPGWQLLVSAKRGRQGDRGERGERGPAGPPAPSILAWEIDRKAYAAIPVMSDGVSGPVLSLRPLFEQFQAETG
jgi:hypothetical protein